MSDHLLNLGFRWGSRRQLRGDHLLRALTPSHLGLEFDLDLLKHFLLSFPLNEQGLLCFSMSLELR